MGGLVAKGNTAKLAKDLQSLGDAILGRAVPRAVNELLDQAETAGFRSIASTHGVPARTMAQYAETKSADANNPEGRIRVKGGGFPLKEFKPVQTKQGVSVVIKGRRIVVPHSFLVAKLGNHVFARGAYGGKGIVPTGETSGAFAYGRKRLPISKLFTFGPADAFSANTTQDAMRSRVDEQAGKVLKREIDAVARGY